MQKLYQRSEITFAILWIVVYVAGTSAADQLSRLAGMEKSITFVLHLLLTAVLFLWIRRNNLLERYGLCKTDIPAGKFLYYIPLAIAASCNLWLGAAQNLTAVETALDIGSMLCVGFLEEVIFRGILFRAMSRSNVKSAIIVSSVTFGIGHIVNLINGSGMDFAENLCQVCYAIAFGFLFVTIFHRGKTLIPCILTHSILNVLSVFGREPATQAGTIAVSAILTVLAVSYTLILKRTLPKP